VKKYSDGTFGNKIKYWKAWLLQAETIQKKPVNIEYKSKAFFKPRPVTEDFIVLEEDEVEMLWFEREHLSLREQKVVNVMCFTWACGLRISDVLQEQLTLETLEDNRLWLVGKNTKNGTDYMIPVWKHKLPIVQELLLVYENNLDIASDVEINRISKTSYTSSIASMEYIKHRLRCIGK
jgi:integrase